jgi:hypothetical protein
MTDKGSDIHKRVVGDVSHKSRDNHPILAPYNPVIITLHW